VQHQGHCTQKARAEARGENGPSAIAHARENWRDSRRATFWRDRALRHHLGVDALVALRSVGGPLVFLKNQR